jgi:hypothetical protein
LTDEKGGRESVKATPEYSTTGLRPCVLIRPIGYNDLRSGHGERRRDHQRGPQGRHPGSARQRRLRRAKRELFDVWGKTTPLGRAGEPQEIAEAIGFLASPRAGYITGTNIAVDGGSTAA